MATPKSYKEVVETIESIVNSHIAVAQFAVGLNSDIDVETNTKNPVKYPLVFLRPEQSYMQKFGKLSLGFTLSVLDISHDQELYEINGHNSTLMILQDILSKIYLDLNIDLNIEDIVNITPITGRYNNMLLGWEAILLLDVQSPYSLCEAAFSS